MIILTCSHLKIKVKVDKVNAPHESAIVLSPVHFSALYANTDIRSEPHAILSNYLHLIRV